MQTGYNIVTAEKTENLPISGYTILYCWLHCGQLTSAVALCFCFSSIHLWRHLTCTHLAVPLHRQGVTQSIRVSSSVPKHTQHVLLQ